MSTELSSFLPYLLYRSAEQTSLDFQRHYRERYGMLRTEWRVLFHVGQDGAQTAREICNLAGLHKTKVSRAVHALAAKRFLHRETNPLDRRSERLSLTKAGQATLIDLSERAAHFERSYEDMLGAQDLATLKTILGKLIELR